MTGIPRPADLDPASLDWQRLVGPVIEDAQTTLGVPFLLLSRYDRARQMSVSVAWGGLRLRHVQRAVKLARRLVPGYEPLYSEVAVSASPFTRALYLEGRHEIVVVPTVRLVEGVAPPIVAQVAARIAGAAYGAVIPLIVDGEAIGAITCFQPRPDFGPLRLAVVQAFARQTALSIHNAQLLAEQRRVAQALAESRRLIIEAQDHTRREISEVLHSRVQSRLLVAWHQLADVQAADPESGQRLQEVRVGLEHLREHDVRRLSHQLHPEGLQMGLIPALQVLASESGGALQMQIQANSALVQADQPGRAGLPVPVRLLAFRAMEEAASNVLKHAGTGEVTISLELRDQHLTASAQDCGQGFDPKTTRAGLGVRLLMARVEAAGGTWGLESRPGGPTRVWLRVPV